MTAAASAPGLSVVVPCYNEEPCLEENLARILAYLRHNTGAFEILVVDDGSTDAGPALIRRMAEKNPELRLLSLGRNMGKGAAVRRGFLEARGEWVLVTDADLSAPIDLYKAFAKRAAQPDAPDAVIGSRPHPDSHIEIFQPWLRRKMGETFNAILRLLTRLPYADTQCGFKLFRREAFLPVFEALQTAGFAFDVEVLLRARKAGLRVAEQPVVWRNDPRSSVRIFHDSFRMLTDVLGMWRRGL